MMEKIATFGLSTQFLLQKAVLYKRRFLPKFRNRGIHGSVSMFGVCDQYCRSVRTHVRNARSAVKSTFSLINGAGMLGMFGMFGLFGMVRNVRMFGMFGMVRMFGIFGTLGDVRHLRRCS